MGWWWCSSAAKQSSMLKREGGGEGRGIKKKRYVVKGKGKGKEMRC